MSLVFGEDQNTKVILYIIVGTFFFVCQYFVISWYNEYTSTTGTIISIDNPGNKCVTSYNSYGKLSYYCLFTVSYEYKEYSGTTQLEKTSSVPLSAGEKIDLVYLTDSPSYPPTLPTRSWWFYVILGIFAYLFYIIAYNFYRLVIPDTFNIGIASRGVTSIGTGLGKDIGGIIKN
jgi:hypothetical protein